MKTNKIGLENDKFFSCSHQSNCVNSMASASDKKHYVAPLIIEKTKKDILAFIIDHLKKWQRTKLMTQTDKYLHFEIKSAFFGFIDDLEIFWPKGDEYLHFKSSSRIGYTDFGVNRKRVEQLKKELLLRL